MENEMPNKSRIEKTIAVMSGKGGVGKSSITGSLAVELKRRDYKVGVLDGDITGPSIPKMFGINSKRPGQNEEGLLPVETVTGIKVMSLNLLMDSEDSPVIWRGPLIANTVKQFYTEVMWGDLDYLLIDLPPGTGDVPLTVMQSFPVDGIIIVSSPQDLVHLIVKKSVNMVKKLEVPILGVIENMSYLECPDCKRRIEVFGKSKVDDVTLKMGVDLLGKLPLDPELAELCDDGRIEVYGMINESMKEIADRIENKLGGVK